MDYDLIPTKKENLELYSKLLSGVFKETNKFTIDFLNWQYFKNPHGDVLGYDAFYNGELVAHYVTIPVVYTLNNTFIKGLLSLNTATTSDHQGKGLFTKLASATYTLAKEKGYDFIIGVANQNSTHGFIKKLGFNLIGKLEVKIYIGSLKEHTNSSNYFRATWNESSLNWRLKCPSSTYFKKGNSIYSNTHIPLIKSLMLTKTDAIITDLNKINFIPFKMTIGFNLGKPSFSINLPEKLKPSPLNLIFKDLSVTGLNVSKKNCYFELIDFDAY